MSIEAVLETQRKNARADGREPTIHHCRADHTLREVVDRLTSARIGAMPVLGGADDDATDSPGDRVIGVVSERDVMRCLQAHGAAALDAPVAQAMTAPAVSIDRTTPVLVALSLMTRRRIRHLPVLEGDAMIGFVSIGDLVKHRIERIEAEAAALRDYIAG